MNRNGAGWIVLRVCIGMFFLFEGIGKIGWFTHPAILAGQLSTWMQAAPAGSISRVYLERIAMPYEPIFARLVPLGELTCGLGLIAGYGTRLFALIAFIMALNFHVAGGTLFKYAFLTNGYGLPVLGSTLALALSPPSARVPRPKRGVRSEVS